MGSKRMSKLYRHMTLPAETYHTELLAFGDAQCRMGEYVVIPAHKRGAAPASLSRNMLNCESIRKLGVVMPVFIAFAFLLIIPSTSVLSDNTSYFGTTHLVYGQPDQMNSNITNSVDIQNIPVKKVHLGDIDTG